MLMVVIKYTQENLECDNTIVYSVYNIHELKFLNFAESGLQKLARSRYDDVVKGFGEYLVSGSDDFTLFLWTPEKDKKSIGKQAITSNQIGALT